MVEKICCYDQREFAACSILRERYAKGELWGSASPSEGRLHGNSLNGAGGRLTIYEPIARSGPASVPVVSDPSFPALMALTGGSGAVKAERPESLAVLVHLAPKIIAGKTDMLPAQWRDVGKQFVRHLDTAAAQMPDGTVETDGVPKGDGRGEQGQPGGTMTLVLERAVAQFVHALW